MAAANPNSPAAARSVSAITTMGVRRGEDMAELLGWAGSRSGRRRHSGRDGGKLLGLCFGGRAISALQAVVRNLSHRKNAFMGTHQRRGGVCSLNIGRRGDTQLPLRAAVAADENFIEFHEFGPFFCSHERVSRRGLDEIKETPAARVPNGDAWTERFDGASGRTGRVPSERALLATDQMCLDPGLPPRRQAGV